ncbi:hypothetical protein [Natranaerobius trueperi]|nr:hypothetical protein [Natranaerobius trueperi]
MGGYLYDLFRSYNYSIGFALGSFIISALLASILPLEEKKN